MSDQVRSREQLVAELEALRRRVDEHTSALAKADEELVLFRKFAEASSQGFSMARLDGHITYVNPALCRMLGEERAEDVVGKHLTAFFSEETNLRGEQEIVPALDREGRWEGELPMLSRHGTSIPTWHSTFVIRDEGGKPLRIAVVITDIRERKKAEETVRVSHQHLQAVLDGMVDGFAIFDIESLRPVRANTALCTMLGYTEAEIKDLTPEQKHPADALPKIKQHYEAVLQGIESRYDAMPCIRKDGSLRYLDVTSKHILYDGRRSLLLFFHDVTERKMAQESLERERRTLRHLLQSSDHERQSIAYDIHDGLAQYLAGALMQFDSFAYLKDRQPDEAAKVFDSGRTMLRQGHFEARRLISGVRPPVLDESGVVEAIAHLVHEETRQKGPRIEFASTVDFDRLASILENAIYRITQESLANACKHSQSRRVRVRLAQRGDRVRIEIRDWGVGFEPKRTREGCFGIEGIRQRARLLGGKCSIQSRSGKGTRVRVELPVVLRSREP